MIRRASREAEETRTNDADDWRKRGDMECAQAGLASHSAEQDLKVVHRNFRKVGRLLKPRAGF
jgi:hypothetical protein